MMQRCLVVGGDGLIGRSLVQHWRKAGVPVMTTTRRQPSSECVRLDLDEVQDDWLPPEGCGVAVLCAGVTHQKSCLERPDQTRRINVEQTLKLARALARSGCFVVFLSTNLVFDGLRPFPPVDTPQNPKTEYGRQKTRVEQSLAEKGDGWAVVRLTKVIHLGLPLISHWREALALRRSVEAFDDYVCSPISLDVAIKAIAQIAVGRHPGFWHVSGADDVSYASLARLLSAEMNRDPALVQTRSGGSSMEHLPRFATLDSSATRREFAIVAPTAREVVAGLLTNS